jgi:glutathione S-transferase
LYRFPLSGHSHRVELFLSLLHLPVELIEVDLAAGQQKSPDFLRLNIFGQVPVIQDGEYTIADSNAILIYLAKRYGAQWMPEDPVSAAAVQRWLSVAAGELAFGPAAARMIEVFRAPFNASEVLARAEVLFKIMDVELQDKLFLAGDTPTIADIANYSYTALAPEGKISLQPYLNIRAWLNRMEGLPGFIPMQTAKIAG